MKTTRGQMPAEILTSLIYDLAYGMAEAAEKGHKGYLTFNAVALGNVLDRSEGSLLPDVRDALANVGIPVCALEIALMEGED